MNWGIYGPRNEREYKRTVNLSFRRLKLLQEILLVTRGISLPLLLIHRLPVTGTNQVPVMLYNKDASSENEGGSCQNPRSSN